jgi:hypothetical protein
MRIEAVLLKNIQDQKIIQNMIYLWIFGRFVSNIAKKTGLRVLVQALGALWDLRYFSSTNNLRLDKIFLQMRIEAILLKIYKIENHPICITFRRLWSISPQICQFLGFTYYGTSTRCSAGSEIFCLGKQSETC